MFTWNEMLDDVVLYWPTNAGASSARLLSALPSINESVRLVVDTETGSNVTRVLPA